MRKGDFSFQLIFTCEYHSRIAVSLISFLTEPAGYHFASDVTGQIAVAFNETNFVDRDEHFLYEIGPWPHVYLGQFF